MSSHRHVNLSLRLSVSVSLLGLITVSVLTLYMPKVLEDVPLRKPMVGSIFAMICISGIIAGCRPRECSKAIDVQSEGKHVDLHGRNLSTCVTVNGHHPDCGEFSAHVFQLREHVFCAACTGLILGAIVAFVGTALYFFAGWSGLINPATVLFGQACIVTGFGQLKFKGLVRSAMNLCFVIGAYLILSGIDTLERNTFIDLYVICLVFIWIWTRILLSQWDHSRICHACQRDCELKEKVKLVSAA